MITADNTKLNVDNRADPALSLLLNSRGNLSNYHVTFYSIYLFCISTIFFLSIIQFTIFILYLLIILTVFLSINYQNPLNFDDLQKIRNKLYTTRLFIIAIYSSVKLISASIQTFPGIFRRLKEDRMYNFFFAYIGSCKMLFI
jgi:hypothetical protein